MLNVAFRIRLYVQVEICSCVQNTFTQKSIFLIPWHYIKKSQHEIRKEKGGESKENLKETSDELVFRVLTSSLYYIDYPRDDVFL